MNIVETEKGSVWVATLDDLPSKGHLLYMCLTNLSLTSN